MSATSESKGDFPLAGSAHDGFNKDGRATATCFCGAVQLAFPTKPPGFIDSFICHCADDRKITASMFASNFLVDDKYIEFLRGRENLTKYAQSKTIGTGNTMTNSFCSTCGTHMSRVSSGLPGHSVLRLGTVDDFSLHENELKPEVEQFAERRVNWLESVKDVRQHEGESHKF